ncbi:MAG TPA: hypothetical protein VFW11_17835 [Cyclobacteriaceae bacterium]|nr:hypothetical protein [Cyclobacteriaceae bacterium]
MTKTFTEHDLIRYLYREITEKEEKQISNALLCDSELLALYNELSAIKKRLEGALLEPSSQTVLNILSYARGVKTKD